MGSMPKEKYYELATGFKKKKGDIDPDNNFVGERADCYNLSHSELKEFEI